MPEGTVLGHVLFTIMVNDISPTSQNTLMTKYADDITCSIPVRPNVNDSASEEVENLNLMKPETHKGLKRVTLICLLCPMLVIIHFRKYHIWNEKKR